MERLVAVHPNALVPTPHSAALIRRLLRLALAAPDVVRAKSQHLGPVRVDRGVGGAPCGVHDRADVLVMFGKVLEEP